MTLSQARLQAVDILTRGNFISPTPRLDADVILQALTGKQRSYLLAHDDESIDAIAQKKGQEALFFDLLERRLKGTPIAYLTNHKEFFGFDFYVTPDVLIPKPDTELLVEHALEAIRSHFHFSHVSIADICTGSGCVALSIAKTLLEKDNFNSFSIDCTDISSNALSIAKKNASRLLQTDDLCKIVSFYEGDLLFPLFKKYDVILSNPPYVPSSLTDELLKDGRGEPRLALDGDSDGLAVIRRLIPQVYDSLNPMGEFYIETGEYNAVVSAKILAECGFESIETFYDMAGNLRVSKGVKPLADKK